MRIHLQKCDNVQKKPPQNKLEVRRTNGIITKLMSKLEE